MRRARFTIVNTIFSILATSLAALAFWPVYRSAAFLLLVAVAVLLGHAIALCGAVFRASTAVVTLATVACFFVVGVPLAVPDEAIGGILPSWQGILDLATGTALGWKQLLTISVPVGSYQALLVPALLLVLASSVVSLTIALRVRRGELAVVVPSTLFVVGILFGPRYAADPATVPIAMSLGLLAVALTWLIWMRWRRRSTAIGLLTESPPWVVETRRVHRLTGVRTALGAAVIIAVAAVAGTAATVLVPAQNARSVLRTTIEKPFDPREASSPLSGFRGYLEPANATKVLFTVAGLGAGDRIRIATLDTYDGVVYSVGSGQVSSASGSFTRVPDRLDQSGVAGRREHLRITVEGYSGLWLPGAGRLQQLWFSGKGASRLADSLYYNDTTGTSVVTAGLARGDSYRMDAVVGPTRTVAELSGTRPGPATLPKITVVPEELDHTLQGYTGAEKTPGAKLAAALGGLKANGYISHGLSANEPASRSGHGADRITQLLTDVPMVGDQEQYAVTAALMARELGYPARVVMGFVPKPVGASGDLVVTGNDVSAWIQVQTAADGWVGVDPNPAVRPVPEKQPDEPKAISRPQSIVQPPQESRNDHVSPAPQSHLDDQKKPVENALAIFLLAAAKVLGATVLILAILAAPFVAIIGAKARRRTLRRSSLTSIERISGGWQEFADAAVDFGYEPPPAATRSEFAEMVGGMRPLVLASVSDRAIFSPTAPTVEEADQVWRAVAELRHSLGEGRTRWQRILARISLRSLGGYRGRMRERGGAPK